MIGILVLSVLLPPTFVRAEAPSAEREVSEAFDRITQIIRRQEERDGQTTTSNDEIESLKFRVVRLGRPAVAPLGLIAQDRRRPTTVRRWALHFAVYIGDPSAIPFTERILLDPAQPVPLRSDAATHLLSLDGKGDKALKAVCSVIEDSRLDGRLLRKLLIELSRRGCPDTRALARWAVRFGPRPSREDAHNAHWILEALERSRSASAAKALLDLFRFYPPGSKERQRALDALLRLPPELSAYRRKALKAMSSPPGNP